MQPKAASSLQKASLRQLCQEFGGGEEGLGQTVYVYDATQEPNDLGVLIMRQHCLIIHGLFESDRCPLTGKNVNPFTTLVRKPTG